MGFQGRVAVGFPQPLCRPSRSLPGALWVYAPSFSAVNKKNDYINNEAVAVEV